MRGLKWLGVLLGILVAASGCSAPSNLAITEPMAVRLEGTLVSGRYTTEQGTIRIQREFLIHPDRRVTVIQSLEGTHKFADFWRERFKGTSQSTEYAVTKEEAGDRVVLRAKRTFGSLDNFNQSGEAEMTLLDGPFFRSVSFRTETGSFDAQSMVDIYGVHDQATAEDWVNFLRGAISLGYVVTDEASGLSYHWDRTAGQIGDGVAVVIAAKQWHRLAYWGGGVLTIFLGFVVYMGLFGRRHWEAREQE